MRRQLPTAVAAHSTGDCARRPRTTGRLGLEPGSRLLRAGHRPDRTSFNPNAQRRRMAGGVPQPLVRARTRARNCSPNH